MKTLCKQGGKGLKKVYVMKANIKFDFIVVRVKKQRKIIDGLLCKGIT
ncbi:MAG: hypothetical protein K0R57_5156 [Paenibacillaceae bacterium]|nr:hypothetical protein [Paenibacillaceae bacterium]